MLLELNTILSNEDKIQEIWVLWKTRNEKFFKNKMKVIEDMVEEVKILSWKWSLRRLKVCPYLFYEWCWNPDDCLNR